MTIGFSKNWSHYSWSSKNYISKEEEQLLIEEMIRNCDNQTIKNYAGSDKEFGVYVRTGLHSSKSEPRDHIQMVLGKNDPDDWNSESGFTAHIIYHDPASNRTKPYEAHLYAKQPHLRKK